MFSESAIATLNDSDFLDRFLGFMEQYGNFRNVDLYSFASAWVDKGELYSIRYYLAPTPKEDSIPFTLADFVSMDATQITAWHDYCQRLKALLDEKNSLYNEFESIISK